MRSYSSSSSESSIVDPENTQPPQLFRYDTSLARCVETINIWKQHTHLSNFQYLRQESCVVELEDKLVSCGTQLRAMAFCQKILDAFQELNKKYKQVYETKLQQKIQQIAKLDRQLSTLVEYLHKLEGNNILQLYNELQTQGINKIYQNLHKSIRYCIDLQTLWMAVITPRLFRIDQKAYLYKYNYGGTLLYYQKEMNYLLDRIKRAEIQGFIPFPQTEEEFVQAISGVVSSDKLKTHLKDKVLSLLKGQKYAKKVQKNLKEEFILASFQMYHGEESSQLWNYENYQKLCLQITTKALQSSQYLDYFLNAQVESIPYERRKLTADFANIYMAILEKIVTLGQQNQQKQVKQVEQIKQIKQESKQSPKTIQIPLNFIKTLIQSPYYASTFAHLIVNFLLSNKSALSQNNPSLNKSLFDILEYIKQIYLSFGSNKWIAPSKILSSFTNRFFTKFSQDIKGEIVAALPIMVDNLGQDKLPTITHITNENKVTRKLVTRSQALESMFYYILDAEYRDQDFYLDLPQVIPSNFQTAVLFIRTLYLKLRHHEPSEDQKKLWNMIIQESVNFYKIKVDLKWFRPQKRVDVQEREFQFLIQKQIEQEWAYKLMQKMLNFRDSAKLFMLQENPENVIIQSEIINYFKYAVNMKVDAEKWIRSIQQYDIFSILERMRTLLQINFTNTNIFNLKPEQQVTLNELNLCLKFYNVRVKQAKGNEIYEMIVHKIILPWVESKDEQACISFKNTYTSFFQPYILQQHYLAIADSIINIITQCQNHTLILMKIQFFKTLFEEMKPPSYQTVEANIQFVMRIYSIISSESHVDVIMMVAKLVMVMIKKQQKLGEFVDIEYLAVLLIDKEDETVVLKNDESFSIMSAIINKLPEIIDTMKSKVLLSILKGYFKLHAANNPGGLQFLNSSLNKIKKDSVLIALFRVLVSEHKLDFLSKELKIGEQRLKQYEQSVSKNWETLNQVLDANIAQRKQGQDQINIIQICQTFSLLDVLKQIREQYRNFLHSDVKKKSSLKKKSLVQTKQIVQIKEEKKQNEQKLQKKESLKQNKIQTSQKKKKIQNLVKIWRKLVRNYGTFEDVIIFGQDPMQQIGFSEKQIEQNCLKIIEQKNIQQKYLKSIIRKLPILQKCAEKIVEKYKNSEVIQPELICKLIMINSKFRSKIVEQFILQHIQKIPISIQIYQDYLVFDIQKKLQNIPKDMMSKLFYQNFSEDTLKKVDEIFNKLVYLPIKKFQNVYLKFEQKIQQNQQGQEWQTQSQKNSKSSASEQQQKQNKKPKQNRMNLNQSSSVNDADDSSSSSSQNLDLHEDDSNDDDIVSEPEQDYDEEQYDENENKQEIVKMFYEEGNLQLSAYKDFIVLREELNIYLGNNYLSFQEILKKVKDDLQIQKKMFRIIDILQNLITQANIVTQILTQVPQSFYNLLKQYGLTKQRDEKKYRKLRKQKTKIPHFVKQQQQHEQNQQNDQISQNSENNNQQYDQQYQQSNDLSEQEDSQNNDLLNDGLYFVLGEDGQLAQVSADDFQINQTEQSEEDQQQSQQIKVVQKLQQQSHQTLTLPHLKQINSKIEMQLTGKQLSPQDMTKIIEISIIKLMSMNLYQLKHKHVMSFYQNLINSKQGKIFVDTLLTILRVDELYSQNQKLLLAQKLAKYDLSLQKAVTNFLQIAYEIATEQSKQGNDFVNLIKDEVGRLLPIADQIMVKSDIPIQDNYLTILVLFSSYPQQQIHSKIKKLLSTLNSDQKRQYKLTKTKAALLTRHIYKNSNTSSIWINMQDDFGVNINTKTKFSSCLSVYGRLLRQDVEKCYRDLLEIVGQNNQIITEKNKQSEIQNEKILKQQQKKVEQNLKRHFRRIKHYYYWNKRNFIQQLPDLSQKYSKKLLKDKQLIKLTELMIFYCHFIKQKFFTKIDQLSIKNLLKLPKSIIETSFMFLWKLHAKIQNWLPLQTVQQYFKKYSLYQHKFSNLLEVCNLTLQFLQLPSFSSPKFKQIIIPYFIEHPSMAHSIPLVFKLPNQQIGGQKLYLTRECSFDMAFYQLQSNSLTIQFRNQQGSDHGGMVRELMMGWTGEGIGEEYLFLGKILAFSFRKSVPYGGHIDIGMAVAITQFKVTVDFVAELEPEVAKSLKYIQENDPADLELNFQISKQLHGKLIHYPLIQNGSNVKVTNENKTEYIKLFLQKYYIIGREWEMSELCAGFWSSVNKKYAAIFNPFEVVNKIQGQQIKDYMKLKAKTKYQQGYTDSSQMIKWFWQIVSSFNQKQMNKFLQFITGAPKVSIYNHNFQFVIEKPYTDDQQKLPVAHTCFNTLELPEYKTKEILEAKIKMAIFQGNDNFGIL